ncbi:MAG: phosphate ABC transporter permease subunit PstC [Cyanobacteria bacterium P01_B01_bin.77]
MTSFRSRALFPQQIDWVLVWALRSIATLVGALVILITFFLIWEAWPLLTSMNWLRFLNDDTWQPSQNLYQMTPMIIGTLAVVIGALLLAIPAGILSGLWCHYYAPKPIAAFYRNLLKLLAGIPGVVYGFWGLVVIVPQLNRLHPPGSSLLAGILLLALLILPTITLTFDANLTEVRQTYWQDTAALGLSHWGTIWGVVVPSARVGLFTGILLGTGRALGETIIVLMVCGNIPQIPTSLFDPIRTLPANIALEMAFALDQHRSALFVSGLLLMGISLVLALLAETIAEEEIYG